MITTFSEVQALLMLYQACPDDATRRRAAALVPGLEELSGTLTFAGSARRRKLTAFTGTGAGRYRLGQRFVVCCDKDLDEYKRDYALVFDLAEHAVVDAEDA